MEQNKLQKSDTKGLWHCLLRNGNPYVTFAEEKVPWQLHSIHPHFMLCQLGNGVIPDGEDSELRGTKIWHQKAKGKKSMDQV